MIFLQMKENPTKTILLTVLALGLSLAPKVQAHINAGALSTAQGGQLYFAGAQGYLDSSGFVITNDESALPYTMGYSNVGTWAGFYVGRSPTFTALATTNSGGPPSPFAAAPGSFIQVRLETVLSGPAGGIFSFWESGSLTPTLNLGVGNSVASGNLIPLSDASKGAGNPGNDPYGHLHGRRYGANLPGDYLVGFRIVDTSVNGAGGGPIQSDSQLYVLGFRAVPEPSTLVLAAAGAGIMGFAFRRRRTN